MTAHDPAHWLHRSLHGNAWLSGLSGVLFMGVLLASSAAFAEAGHQNVTSLPTWLTLEGVYYLLHFSVVSAIIGSTYAKGESIRGLR